MSPINRAAADDQATGVTQEVESGKAKTDKKRRFNSISAMATRRARRTIRPRVSWNCCPSASDLNGKDRNRSR